MEIVFNTKNEIDFEVLVEGDTFIDREYDAGAVLMVVEPTLEIDMKANKKLVDDDFYGYAVDLSTGGILGYNRTDKVIQVYTKLTVDLVDKS